MDLAIIESAIESAINKKINLLVDFILFKNPHANKTQINHKLKELGLFRICPKTSITQTIESKRPKLTVIKSKAGNYILQGDQNHIFEDLRKNKFVLDLTTKKISGIENCNGEIEPLSKSLIEICHKYKLKYDIPLNLNTSDIMEEDNLIVNDMQELNLSYANSEEDDITEE